MNMYAKFLSKILANLNPAPYLGHDQGMQVWFNKNNILY